MIFQCLPIAADALFERARGSSVIVVISPLRSLMEDQVRHLNDIGVPAIAITDDEDPELMQQVLNGNSVLVFQTLNFGDYVELFPSLHEQYSLVTLFYNTTA